MPHAHPYLLLPALLVALAGPASAAFGQTATFAPVVTYASGAAASYPTSLAVADVNGDGRLDVLIANNGSSTLAVLLGNGAGGFALQATAPSTGAGTNPNGLVVADVNGDGKPDALTANNGNHSVSVLLGNGSGNFTLQAPAATTSTTSGPYSLAVADVNGDGKPDVLAANNGTDRLDVLLGNGMGGFTVQTPAVATGTGGGPQSVAVADVNADGKPDALVANYGANTVSVLLGTGTGSFVLQAVAPGTGANSQPVSLAVADVNRDGKPDVLTANVGSNTVGVLLGNGAGGFTLQAPASATGTGTSPQGVAVADVNGDGKPDLLTANTLTSTMSVLLGNSSGTFTLQAPAVSIGASGLPQRLVAADVNNDGKPDVLAVNFGTSTLGVLLNTTTFLPTRATLPGATLTLAPNPTHAGATLTATGLPAPATQLAAMLTDALGRPVLQLTVPAMAGTVTAPVPTTGLAAGLYVLRLDAVDAQGAPLGSLPTQQLSVAE